MKRYFSFTDLDWFEFYISLYRFHAVEGSTMLSSPQIMSCLSSSLTALTVGKHGIDISPPGSWHLRLLICGVVSALLSNWDVLMPCLIAVSFRICPAYVLYCLVWPWQMSFSWCSGERSTNPAFHRQDPSSCFPQVGSVILQWSRWLLLLKTQLRQVQSWLHFELTVRNYTLQF